MKTNRLVQEKSPYLKQHAGNPVDWYPWGEEAFARARRERKPIFLSIGYSTCYWCHVMEKDSFERDDVAAALNGSFVSIKVDREEHPEVDEIYMDAVVAMTGHGGWPMSVFLTPDLNPFWGGTYIPRAHFLALLERIRTLWSEKPEEIERGGAKLLELLREEEAAASAEGKSAPEILALALEQMERRFDRVHGGFGDAPKFPPSSSLRLLLRLSAAGKREADPILTRTLEAMACGGIYDHVGGGFHRYATDTEWLIPHFEKMLYDNALLARTYAEAFQATGRAMYKDVCRETLDYLLRDMKSPEGAFYSAEDAGEVGREGDYYVWDLAEIEGVLGEGMKRLPFPVSQEGNFEHRNILHLPSPDAWDLSRNAESKALRENLFTARGKRARPHRDNKILSAWNGLALAALAKAGAVLAERRYVEAAESCASWMREKLWDGNILFRRHCEGETKYSGTSSDYAFLIDGLLELYQASWNEEWLLWARELQKSMDRDFWDDSKGGYFTASREEKNLVVRKKDLADGALPSPNSVALQNLLRLAPVFFDAEMEERAEQLLATLRSTLERVPMAATEACLGVYAKAGARRQLVVSGTDSIRVDNLLREIQGTFLPELFLVRGRSDSKLPIAHGKESKDPAVGFLCENESCRAPEQGDALLQLLKELPASTLV